MPGFKNTTKPQGKKTKAAVDKNERAIARVLNNEGEPPVFGRVEKPLGNSMFIVAFHDGKELHQIQATPRGVFNAGGKVRVDISIGDIVLLDGTEFLNEAWARGNKLIVEIWARFSKKDAQLLYDAGRIHKTVYSSAVEETVDDVFDYSKGEKDTDINVDAI